MRKEWFSSKELTAFDGLPSTIQGMNRKARKEGWQFRKRRGVQGKALEYHIDSLPDYVRCHMKELKESKNHDMMGTDLANIWDFAYSQLTKKEQQVVIKWLLRHGLKELLDFIVLSNKAKGEGSKTATGQDPS